MQDFGDNTRDPNRLAYAMSGPLSGLRIIEFAGLGPGPFAAMAMSDSGADIIRVDRPNSSIDPAILDDPVLFGRTLNLMNRGRRSVTVDLKHPEGIDFALALIERADALIEGFRPGVMERLGLGPDVCLELNPRLVYGRVTGWGRHGPYAQTAGHDVDYLALSGSLGAIGPANGPPVPPLNLLGDFGGGGLLLAYGITCALLEAKASGKGQVVDTAMVSGVAYLSTYIYGMRALGLWNDRRGANVLDGGAPFYQVYETSDGRYLAVGAVEDHFFGEVLRLVGFTDLVAPKPSDRDSWASIHEKLKAMFKTRTRDEWEQVFVGTDACVAPVLSMSEAPEHEHLRQLGTFIEIEGVVQPAPAPYFSRTPGAVARAAPKPGQGGLTALRERGFEQTEIDNLRESEFVIADDEVQDG